MKHRAKLKINDRITDGYHCVIEEKHYLILSDAEVIAPDPALDLVITGFVEIDLDTLQPVRTFGSEVAARRKSLGLSQEKLAQAAGISRNYLSQIERGEAKDLSAKVLFGIGRALGTSNEELIKMWKAGQ